MRKLRQGGFLIAKIHQISGRIFAGMLRDAGIEINPAQGRILFVLWQQDGIPIQTLREKTSLEKSTLTSMLDRLEEAGFVRRRFSTRDRRQILIERTDKDRALEQKYVAVSEEMTPAGSPFPKASGFLDERKASAYATSPAVLCPTAGRTPSQSPRRVDRIMVTGYLK